MTSCEDESDLSLVTVLTDSLLNLWTRNQKNVPPGPIRGRIIAAGAALEGQEVHYFDRTLLCRAHKPVSIGPWLSYASTSVTCSTDPLLIINQWNKAARLMMTRLLVGPLLRETARNTISVSHTDTNRYDTSHAWYFNGCLGDARRSVSTARVITERWQ